MRWVTLGLVVCASAGCKKAGEPAKDLQVGPPTITPGSAAVQPHDAASAGDAAAPVAVDLFAATPSLVRVSSQVKNPRIEPRHLADRDLATAWSSRTGELAGAWIEVTVPGGVINELRMTVGHTGTGPSREDYFTMNPRIRAVELLDGTKVIATVPLDIARRDRQAIAVPGLGTVRIRVSQIEPGSKRAWREVAISELEAWGWPPPGWTPPGKPLIPTVEVEPPPRTSPFDALCASLEADREDRERRVRASEKACARLKQPERDQCNTDPPGEPRCGVTDVGVTGLVPPWRAVATHCSTSDDVYGPSGCSFVFDIDGRLAHGPGFEIDHRGADLEVASAEAVDVIPGGPPELVLRYGHRDYGDLTEELAICSADGTPGCSKPIAVGGTDWKAKARIDKGVVIVEAETGTPPPKALGRHPIVFD